MSNAQRTIDPNGAQQNSQGTDMQWEPVRRCDPVLVLRAQRNADTEYIPECFSLINDATCSTGYLCYGDKTKVDIGEHQPRLNLSGDAFHFKVHDYLNTCSGSKGV